MTLIDNLTGWQWFYIAQIVYKIVIGLTKTSILLLYLRIFVRKYFRRLCYVSLFIVITWSFGSVMATVLQCLPISASWNKAVPNSRCIDSDVFWISYGILNIVTDVVILLLPVREVIRLQVPRREKIGLLVVFLLGALSVHPHQDILVHILTV